MEREKAGKRARKANKDPNKPKKPQTAYWLWLTDNRPALIKELGGTKDVTKVSKFGGERWGALSDKAKAPFLNKAAELKAVYDKAMVEYKKTAGANADDDDDEGEDDGEEE